MSDAFKRAAPVEVTRNISLAPSRVGHTDYYDLALPQVGTRVIESLRTFAATRVENRDAILAEALADAIAQRVSSE